jgi:hypothetical protein
MDEAYGMKRIQSSNYQALSRFNVSILWQELIYKEDSLFDIELCCACMQLPVQTESKVMTTSGENRRRWWLRQVPKREKKKKKRKLIHAP